MAVCKFFLEGRCKFGDKCRHEHPGQQVPFVSQPRDVFASSNRGPANRFEPLDNRISGFGRGGGSERGDVGGGRGGGGGGRGGRNTGLFTQPAPEQRSRGFQPRDSNRDRRNDVTHHRDSYGITAAGLEDELKNNRPIWIMSCYGPGNHAPIQLFGGYPLEQSPEELRTAHYLAVENGSPQESAQMEQGLATLSNAQVENVLNDLHGAIEYVASGSEQHPNRLDELSDLDRNTRHGLFSQQNQRAHRGVFRDQKRPPRDVPPAQFGTKPSSNQPQPRPSSNSSPFGVTTASSALGASQGFNQQLAPGFGQQSQIGQTGPFGAQQAPQASLSNALSAYGGWGLPQPASFGTLSQPQQTAINNFSQPTGQEPISQFTQQQPATAFGHPQPQPTALMPGSPMDSGASGNAFGTQPLGSMNSSAAFTAPTATNNAFSAKNPPTSGLPNLINRANSTVTQPDATLSLDLKNNGFAGNCQGNAGPVVNGNMFANAGINGNDGNGAGQSELEQAYRYMVQHGSFKDGIMPETAPDPMWLH